MNSTKTIEQSDISERFPACPSPEEIHLVELELRQNPDPERRREILSHFLGSLDPDIELVDQAAIIQADSRKSRSAAA